MSVHPPADPAVSEPVSHRGRPRDASRDEAICRAALDIVAEKGYDCLTMELVAARAKAGKATIYRRWASKSELVIDALVLVKPIVSIDTGSLDGDLAALVEAGRTERAAYTSCVMAGIASALARDPDLLASFRERVTEPRIARIREALERAQARGELAPHIDVAFAATIVPSLMLQRALSGTPGGRPYLEDVVAKVLRPMLGLPIPTSPPITSTETSE